MEKTDSIVWFCWKGWNTYPVFDYSDYV